MPSPAMTMSVGLVSRALTAGPLSPEVPLAAVPEPVTEPATAAILPVATVTRRTRAPSETRTSPFLSTATARGYDSSAAVAVPLFPVNPSTSGPLPATRAIAPSFVILKIWPSEVPVAT